MVRWAPVAVPLRRRAETAAIVLSLVAAPAVVVLVVAAAACSAWARAALCAYLLFVVADRATPWRGGRPARWLRSAPWFAVVASYFPATLDVPAGARFDGPPHIFAVHPHGVLSIGVLTTLLVNEARARALGLPELRVATITLNVATPVWREIMLALGFIAASRDALAWCLGHGLSVVVVVGGAVESLDAAPGTADLTLAKRRGFVRLALEHGAPLVPVWVFGETETFNPVDVSGPGVAFAAVRAAQRALLRWTGFTVPLVHGRGVLQYDFGVLPRRVPLRVVVGAPVRVPRVPRPTERDVDAAHARYVAALRRLHAEHAPGAPAPTDWAGAPLPRPRLNIVR